MYYNLICILYALLCGQNFILVKSGCYTARRRRKLVCFQKTRTGVIKKTAPTIMTTATTATASTVTPNMNPKEIVKFMDVTVASKYGNDLSNFMCYY
jgi:hypothetical protein